MLNATDFTPLSRPQPSATGATGEPAIPVSSLVTGKPTFPAQPAAVRRALARGALASGLVDDVAPDGGDTSLAAYEPFAAFDLPVQGGGADGYSPQTASAVRWAASSPYATDYTTLLTGSYWSGAEVTGQPVIVTYSFLTSKPSTDPHGLGAALGTFASFTSGQQASAQQALSRWSAVSGILFEQVAPGKGDINFAAYDLSASGAGGEAFYPWGNWNYSTETTSAIHFGADIQANGYGDVIMNTAAETGGAFAYPTLLHEVGHAIGLKHPTDSWTLYPLNVVHNQWDPGVTYDPNFSIMSPGGSGSTLTDITAADIQAIQSIYGTSAAQAAQFSSWSFSATTYTLTATLKDGGQTVRGVSTSNKITGGSGDDTIYAIGQGTNTIYGKAGNDVLVGGSGVNYLDGGAGADTLNGWFGANTYASYADAPATGGLGVAVNLANPFLNSGDAAGDVYLNIHKVQGSAYADTVTGDNAGDILNGGAGNDTITGGTGVDHLNGQAGNDTLNAGAGTSYLDGGAGADTLTGSVGHASYASYADATAAVSVNLLDRSANTGDAAGDSYVNLHKVQGSNYADSITGDNSGDVLNGGAGNDTIIGGTGNDTFIGGAGADILTGGLGADRFQYYGLSDLGDTITDFTAAQNDKIAVSAAGFGGGLTAGPLGAAHFALDAPNAATGQMIWSAASQTLSWDADGIGSGVAKVVAMLPGVTTLTAASIVVI